MSNETKAYCYQCKQAQGYWTRFEKSIQTVGGITLDLLLESAYCETCQSPVAPQPIGEKNLQRIFRAQEALGGI